MTSEPVPSGCTMSTVGATCEVHLMLRGMVDADKEVARLEEKTQKLDAQVDKLKKTMSVEGYEDKVGQFKASCQGLILAKLVSHVT